MNVIKLCLVVLLMMGCKDASEAKQKDPIIPKDSIPNQTGPSTQQQNDSIASSKKETPRLTDENVMSFFQEYDKKHKEDKVRITTDFGTIDIQLFPETMYHRANFIYLTKQNYFDNTQFYRVVKNFVIQGGNSDEMEIAERRNKIGTYLLPPDTKKGFKHDRGVISMPSSEIEDAYKMASPYQFFIVQNPNGAHHLDGQYTAFGKVIDGMDVVDKIAEQETDDSDWPLHNVYIRKVEVME